MLKRFIWIPIVLISGCAQQDVKGVQQDLTALKETVETLKASLADQESLRERITLLESRVEAVDDSLTMLRNRQSLHTMFGKHSSLFAQNLFVRDSTGNLLIYAGAS